jgi:CDP-6-deoxy-D-xylo-4-hexulose-3-dehydrase
MVPLIVKKEEKGKKQKILKIFKKCKIDTRPIIAGNLLKHPAMKNIKYKTFGDFKIANEIFNFAFMIGCSPDLKLNELKCLEKAIKLSNSI